MGKKTIKSTSQRIYLKKFPFLKETAAEINNSNMYFFRLAQIVDKELDKDVSSQDPELITAINTIFYDQVGAYINGFCLKKFSNYMSSSNDSEWGADIVSEAIMENINNFRKYDGKHAITTFTNLHSLHGGTRAVRQKLNLSQYHNEIIPRLHKIFDAYEKQGIDREDITVKMLQEETGLTTAQIEGALEAERFTQIEELDTTTLDKTSSFGNPEEEFFKKEQNEFLNSILQSLLPYERFLLMAKNSILNTPDMKYNADKIGKDPEFLQLVKDAGYEYLIVQDNNREFITKEKVNALYNEVEKHIRNLPCVRQALKKDTPKSIKNTAANSRISIQRIEDSAENENLLWKI